MLRFAGIAAALFTPVIASAHEVYVLTPEQVAHGLATAPVPLSHIVADHALQFAFWAFAAALTIVVVFLMSISRRAERVFDPALMRLKRYAAPVGRVTIGLAFLAGAYYQAIFGPELPLAEVFGPFAPLSAAALAAAGICFLVNKFVRTAALLALALFLIVAAEKGWYALTYMSYLGEIAVLLITARASLHAAGRAGSLARRLAPYSTAILRVCFGISLIFASVYAKLLHGNLALQVASLPLAGHAHSLASYFGFEPHFLVLGAALVELVIGTFFLLGIEIRFTALFLEFWLVLSLWYFGEVVWPHLMLIGIPIAFFLHGYDRYSLEGRFFKRHRVEPVL